jgi:hypothetical protein
MSISTKDFKAIAKKMAVLRPVQGGIDKVQENYNRGKWAMWAEIVDELGNCFIDANSKFNKNTFVEACND